MSSKQTAKRRVDYPMGSVSCATMRTEDLIPTFCYELTQLACARFGHAGILPLKARKVHMALVRNIEKRAHGEDSVLSDDYYASDDADYDLESLSDALGEYAAPYFYFGAHPGDGADYGFWLSEEWDEDFTSIAHRSEADVRIEGHTNIMVEDLSDVPAWFRGEVAVVNDHGNVTLYVKTSRTLREVWAVV